MNISVMITTKNRVEDLKQTCHVLHKLNPPPLEILITADGCSDNTVEFVKSAIPKAKLIVNAKSLGSVASRNRMMREAKGDLVLSLDDDSYPEQLDCIARLSNFFQNRSKVAVAHFPQRTDEYPETLQNSDFGTELLTRSFANSGACLRRDVYLKLAGFEDTFFHMYEEPDYALQCIGAGYEVLYTPLITIRHHYSSTGRSEIKNHHRHARNEFWSAIIRCPFPYVIAVAGYHVFSQFRYASSRGLTWIIQEPIWWFQAIKGFRSCISKRQPISWKLYRKWLTLI